MGTAMTRKFSIRSIAASLPFLLAAGLPQSAVASSLNDVNHIIVIYMENRSFDNLYGSFPSAEGLDNAAATATQLDKDGKPYVTLPPVIDTNTKDKKPDARFPADLPNKPFDIGKYAAMDTMTGDLVHRFWHEQMQIDGGKMDKFAAISDAAALSMG